MKKQLFTLFGAFLLLMGMSAAQADVTVAGATTVSAPVMVTAVTDPVFVFNATKQAVDMQLPKNAAIVALLLIPAPGRECGTLTGNSPTTPIVGTCAAYVGIMTPPGSNLVDTIAADGGWAESVTLVVKLDGVIKSIQISLPVKAPPPPPISNNAAFFDAMFK